LGCAHVLRNEVTIKQKYSWGEFSSEFSAFCHAENS